MKCKAMAVLVAAALLTAAGPLMAQQVVNIAGYNRVDVPAQSDVLLTVPFNKGIEDTMNVDGSPSGTTLPVAAGSLTAGQYDGGTYYVRFIDGGASGLWTTIVANTTGNFTLADADVVALASSGDTFRIYKHHTVGSLLPDKLLGRSFKAGTQVLVFDNDTIGINRSAVSVVTYQVLTIGGTTFAGWTGGDAADTVLAPETRFIVRNPSDDELTIVLDGTPPDHPVAVLVPAGVQHDLMIGSGYPVDMLLGDAGLGGANGRQLLSFDNASSGFNKSASAVTTYQITTIGGTTVEGWTSGDAANTNLIASETFTVRVDGEAGGKVTIQKPY